MKAVAWVGTCLIVLGVAAASAQDRRGTRMSPDDKFVKGAMSGGQLEVKLSQLALQRSTNAKIKQFAQMIIDDHSRANNELTKIAGVSTSATMNPIHTAIYNEISQKQGEEFDECYVISQVLGHTEAIMCFGMEAKKGQKAELKEFAEKTLPTLKKHLHEARRLSDIDDILVEKD
jgi:putative membrane protein